MQKIRKIFVTKGIYWVEVPDAGLYMLCGCPSDSVKHMMKRGLIVTRKDKGFDFETGPNAILLSDVLMQNGRFANMAEFPVLQMLYRQGMIIPGHPNNTGFKPIIVGSEDQVKSQMRYIMRGNYGLISEEEMIEAGATPEFARQLMRMKLKFAFGKIRDTEELLDTRVVKNCEVEILNGVFINHLSLNQFEIRYQEESLKVDLNLQLNESYGVPYALGFHNIKKEYFSVIHSGDGDGWDINRPSMASILNFQGKTYLIDTGPNILNTLLTLGISINRIDGIFHTHAHDDHFTDLATLMQCDHKIKYYATPLVRASVTKKLCALVSMDENNFADYFEVHDLDFNEWNNIDGLEVKPILSPHPVETSIFMFRTLWEDGYKVYAHFADIVSLDVLEGMVTDDENADGVSREFFEKVKNDYMIAADLKKLDIGGGLIHGRAEDFSDDKSKKIILSHTSLELTDVQKEIGSGAPFGMVDVLIPTNQTYVFRYASEFLHSNFPSAPLYNLRTILNNSIVTFNPESIILKNNEIPEFIFLIITGNVEQIQSKLMVDNILSAGALIGEVSSLIGVKSSETYRAISFVQALKIPKQMYINFVKSNDLYTDIKRWRTNRQFLATTWLFGESISYPKQNKFAQAMKYRSYAAGEEVEDDESSGICIIKSGELELFLEHDIFEHLKPGDFFGEEGMLFSTPSLFKVRPMESTEVYTIPYDTLIDTPIIRWRMLEVFKKRRRYLLSVETSGPSLFYWRDVYSVFILQMDSHHKELFFRANSFFEAIRTGKDRNVLEDTLQFLIEYTEFHFMEEEELLKKHNYVDYEAHKLEHAKLVKEVIGFKSGITDDEIKISNTVIEFFKEWIIDHILTKDRKYGHFLNTKGVF